MNFSQETLEECVDGNLNFTKCPVCYEEFDSSRGVSMHYGYNHEGSISYLSRCKQCGDLTFGDSDTVKFCSKDCETLSRTGTLKHQDKDFLRRKIEDEGMRAVDVAEEISVNPKTVWEWVDKYDIGDDYECPSCDESFATKQGVSKHHKDTHDESISGSDYICEYCGEQNWTPRSPGDDQFPKYCDDDCFGADMEGEDNPNKDPERREKIRETMEKVHEESSGKYGNRDREWMMENVIEKRDNDYLYEDNDNIRNGSLISEPQYVEETDRNVRSSWEKEIDILLYGSVIEYQYELSRYDLPNGKTYMPDFEVGNTVIEVKGYIGDGVPKKVELFMDSYPEKKYIVVGEKIPCDIHIEWDNREDLIDVLE